MESPQKGPKARSPHRGSPRRSCNKSPPQSVPNILEIGILLMSEIKDLGFTNQNQNQNQNQSLNLNLMESTKEQSGLLQQILPPRLEDAGLEDCALPPESIHQAFLKAATAVKSIFSDDDDADCVNDPWPTFEDASDAVIGIEPENEPPGPCAVEKGCEAGGDEVKVGGGAEEVWDEVVVGEGGVKLGEAEEPCVDELQGLRIKDKEDVKKGGVGVEEGEEKEKKPTLAEGFGFV